MLLTFQLPLFRFSSNAQSIVRIFSSICLCFSSSPYFVSFTRMTGTRVDEGTTLHLVELLTLLIPSLVVVVDSAFGHGKDCFFTRNLSIGPSSLPLSILDTSFGGIGRSGLLSANLLCGILRILKWFSIFNIGVGLWNEFKMCILHRLLIRGVKIAPRLLIRFFCMISNIYD